MPGTKKEKKQGKLAREILSIVAPKSKEADSDDDETTRARVVEDEDDLENDETWELDFEAPRSQLRARNTKILGDFDQRYEGKKTSRKAMRDEAGDIDEKEHETAELGFMFEASDEEENENEEESETEENGHTGKNFEESSFKFDGNDYDDFGGLSEDEDAEEEEEGEDESGDDQDDIDEDASDNEKESSLLKHNQRSEVKKGVAIKTQLSQWDSLFEIRIQIQKILTKINQYPQPSTWQHFLKNKTNEDDGDLTNYSKHVKKAQTSLANLLDALFEFRAIMIQQNSELKSSVESITRKRTGSESDPDENEADHETSTAPAKKMKLRQYEEVLSQQFETTKKFRDATIEKWNDKTRLATGHLKAKSFAGFEASTLQQIEHILGDKARLVRRTQLKRSTYDILGQEANEDDKEYDAEIFDDDDFYHQLLRDLIERKTEGVTDPQLLGQKWLQIQKMRSKMKKKVDTKASKGRKTRYDIHSKLVNFMAPVYCESVLSDEAKNELFKSLFGKIAK